jgi:hypothetical protein
VASCIDKPMTKAKEWAQLQSQGTLHNASNWAHQCSFREYKLAWWNCKSFGQTYVKNIWKKCCFCVSHRMNEHSHNYHPPHSSMLLVNDKHLSCKRIIVPSCGRAPSLDHAMHHSTHRICK